MASVFLSYSREDADKASALAAALEQSGHQVWWDRHIHGGTEFEGAIEEALNRSDVVVVLWSRASVRSAWVRDEAGEGRDSGRLVPILIDDSRPPMGFRQVQSIDFSAWTGKGAPKTLGALLSAIEARAGQPMPAQPGRQPQRPPEPPSGIGRFGRRPVTVAVLLALLILVGGGFYLTRSPAAAETPIVAVLPFDDLSPGRDKAFLAEGIGEAILSMIARDPSISVIGRTSARQFQGKAADLEDIRRALGVTHVVEGSARTSGDELRMSVRLIDASDGKQIWAEDYQRPISNVFAVQDEIGRAVAERLRGTLSKSVRNAQSPATAVDTYTLYLAARAKMRERKERPLLEALQLARKIVAADPNFAPGHALLADLMKFLDEESYGRIPMEQARRVSTWHARRAIQLAPNSPEGYAALGQALTETEPEAAARALQRAIALDPSRGELRLWLGMVYVEMQRNSEGLEQFRAAAEVDPLLPPILTRIVLSLHGSGRKDEALQVVREFNRRGGSPSASHYALGQVARRDGDLSEAARRFRASRNADPEFSVAEAALRSASFMLGDFAEARRLAAREPLIVQLVMAGENERAVAEIRRLGPDIWGQPTEVVDISGFALGLARDWPALVGMYDAAPRRVQEICRVGRYVSLSLQIASGLTAVGRQSEASAVTGCSESYLAAEARGPVRSPEWPRRALASARAQILALKNDPRAFDEMRAAIELGYRTPHSTGLASLAGFDRFRATEPYRQLDAQLKRLNAAEVSQARGTASAA